MCGIVGIASLGDTVAPSLEQLHNMCQTIYHRGPDDEGVAIVSGVGLGMRRLAIIDLAGGHQPIFNEDRSVCTVFNGEIYNFKELRKKLLECGHVFSTNTDTEVIVHAYEEYGLEFPSCLNGMFAIALHDARKKKLYLVRDHIGIKPLYYAVTEKHVVWGSEIKTILASNVVNRELDFNALGDFFSWEYIPGKKTLYKDIRKLEPGCMLEVDLEHVEVKQRVYWDIPQVIEDRSHTSAEWIEIVDAKILQCVRQQLVSDVPLGAFLSGGIDSSLVVAAMGEAETFSIGFDDPSYNELNYARHVAEHLQVKHTTEVIAPQVVNLFDELMYYMDDPIGDFSIFPTYLVSKLARQHVTVSLSGDGGDELFGGYETYIADDKAKLYGYSPTYLRKYIIEPWVSSLKPRAEKKGFINKLKRFVEGVQEPEGLRHARWRIFVGDAIRVGLFTEEALDQMKAPAGEHIFHLFQKAGNRDQVNQRLYVDVKSYLVDNCLVKVDRMSMARSLESRVPLLDKDMVELAFTIPGNFKIKNGVTKWLLKKVAERHIPNNCIYRQKQGFSIPIKHWLGTQFRPLLEDMLDARRLGKEGIFNIDTVLRLKNEHLAGQANHSHILWSLIVFQSWRSMWLEG